MTTKEHIGQTIRNTILLCAAATGFATSTDFSPAEAHSADNSYAWYTPGFTSDGCAHIWGIQTHQVVPGEQVVLEMSPPARLDFSGRPISLFEATVCVSPEELPSAAIVFQARRNETVPEPSVYFSAP